VKLGILGTADVAQTLAAAWSNARHEIVYGSRDPYTKCLDHPVRGLAEAVADSGIVVNATLGSASIDTLSSIGPDVFAGKTLVDVANDPSQIGPATVFLSGNDPAAKIRGGGLVE
jgi:predicted dinucleotide-binding enzyme